MNVSVSLDWLWFDCCSNLKPRKMLLWTNLEQSLTMHSFAALPSWRSVQNSSTFQLVECRVGRQKFSWLVNSKTGRHHFWPCMHWLKNWSTPQTVHASPKESRPVRYVEYKNCSKGFKHFLKQHHQQTYISMLIIMATSTRNLVTRNLPDLRLETCTQFKILNTVQFPLIHPLYRIYLIEAK